MLALNIHNLCKNYINGPVALNDINLSVEQGEFFAVLGPNGAGKSTLIGVLNSLVRKTSGTVLIYGHNIDTQVSEAKMCLGVVPQEFNFAIFEDVEQIVANQAGYYGLPRALALKRTEKYLKLLDLWGKRREQARRLSGGMKRRLMIARAMVHEPKMLILDEPTAGVDVELRRSLWAFLKKINEEEGKTIILTTHYLEEAEFLCNRVAIINHGKIIADEATQTLIEQLPEETFLLTLSQPLKQPPDLPGYAHRLLDSDILEIDVLHHQDINSIFTMLSAQGISVVSLRNKVNRLEELFVRLVTPNASEHS